MNVKVEKSEIEGVVRPPPSKSYTHRALISSALSRKSRILHPLISRDTMATVRGCEIIGAEIQRRKNEIHVSGVDDIAPAEDYFYADNSGTTLRFFTALLSHSDSEIIIDGDDSLRNRNSIPLIKALNHLGAKITSNSGRPPLKIRGVLKGGEVEIDAWSSQFLSSLLISLPLCKEESRVYVKNLRSRPYVSITEEILIRSGIKFFRDENFRVYDIDGNQEYNLKEIKIPIDYSSASFMIALGVLSGEVEIEGAEKSQQGDERIVDIIKEMGGDVKWRDGKITSRKSEIEGITVDGRDIPDLVPVIAVLSAVAKGTTEITDIEHLRKKETDRIETISLNLRKLGVDVKEMKGGMIIRGKERIDGGKIDSFGDHRIAMAFSILGTVSTNGIEIINAECVSISYPGFFRDLIMLGAKVTYG